MKYVFFDIDRTIRGKSREITKRNKEAICKLRENGHKAFLCTGRAPVSITQDILDVGFDGVISAAGSFIQIDGEYIYENFLDSKLLQQAIVLFSNNKCIAVFSSLLISESSKRFINEYFSSEVKFLSLFMI